MSIDRLDFDNVAENDLRELLEAQVPEGLRIDYKRDLYGNSDADKREALKDVSGFANAFGGHLIIGVEENAGLPIGIPGIANINPDDAVLRLEQLLRTGLEPRVQGLRLRAVPLANGGHCVVLRIPRSWYPLHRVSAQNSNRFWIQNSGGTHEASVDELRTLFTVGADALHRVHQFRDRRLNDINSEENVRPLQREGRLILHIVPLAAVTSSWQVDLAKVFELHQAFRQFVFDGEEEIGSPNLARLLKANRELLRGDLWVICDGPQHPSGRQTVVFGVRGAQTLEITVYGANRELHSGHYGNWAPNPAMMLAQLLASMKDGDGRILVPGFYDGVEPLTEVERAAIDAIPNDDADQMRNLSLARTEGGGKRLAELINLPSLNIRGISSGRTGTQAANVIPTTAAASIDIRLVKGMTRERAVASLIQHIENQGYFVTTAEPGETTLLAHERVARVTVDTGGYNAARTPMNLPVAQRLISSLDKARTPLVLQPTMGGSLPLVVVEEVLESPTITVPTVNYDNNQHSKNENLRIGNLWSAIETMAVLFMME